MYCRKLSCRKSSCVHYDAQKSPFGLLHSEYVDNCCQCSRNYPDRFDKAPIPDGQSTFGDEAPEDEWARDKFD